MTKPNPTKPIAFITGASAGIGMATAVLLAKNGYNIIVSGRRKDRLEILALDLQERYGAVVKVLPFDIRKKELIKQSLKGLSQGWENIDILINNAGLASGLSPIHEGNFDDWETMIDTNIKGLLYITRYIAPIMVERGVGHIVNVSSIAGKEVYANGNVYSATKHAVEALTRSMRIDLLPAGIKVSSVSPGMVETEFSLVRFHGNRERANQVYAGMQPLTPEDVADSIHYIISRPDNVTIADILILPKAQAASTIVKRN